MFNKKTVLELLILTKPISKSSVIPAIGHYFTIRDIDPLIPLRKCIKMQN